ncbi:MAG: nitroreductase family protein, partial [Alphaproteobacteria bacterium]|nr:nitroreductase family protein [Alphaproteobacteria bacterium]
ETIDAVFSLEPLPFRHIMIGGKSDTSNKGKQIILNMCAKIRSYDAHMPIYLMCLPPKNLSDIDDYYNAGVTEFGFNPETFDRDIAKRIMPGKGKIPFEQYLDALKYASGLCKEKGDVKAAFIVGLEPRESLLQGVEAVCKAGAAPILSAFRPVPGTPMEHVVPLSSEEFSDIAKKAQQIADKYGLSLGPNCVPCQNNTLNIVPSMPKQQLLPQQLFAAAKEASFDLRKLTKEIRAKTPPIYMPPAQAWQQETTTLLVLAGGSCRFKEKNFCTMCDYGYGEPIKASEIEKQLDSVFSALKQPIKDLVLLTSGSFLDTKQISRDVLFETLRYVKRFECEAIIFETHYATVNKSILQELKEHCGNAEIVIELGLESADEHVLKNCLNKPIVLKQLEEKVRLIKENGCYFSLNVLFGAPFLTPSQQIDDTVKTIEYAANLGAYKIVVFPINIKESSVVGYLHKQGKYTAPSLSGLAEVLRKISDESLGRIKFSWYGDRQKKGMALYAIPPEYDEDTFRLLEDVMQTESIAERRNLVDKFFSKAEEEKEIKDAAKITRHVIDNRHSTRHFDPNFYLGRSMIESLLDAARKAPSSKNSQPWRFYIINNRQQINSLAEKMLQLNETSTDKKFIDRPSISAINNASAVVFALHKKSVKAMSERGDVFAIGMATENMLIQAAAEGIDSLVLMDPLARHNEIKEFVGLPLDFEAIILLGKERSDNQYHVNKKSLDNIVIKRELSTYVIPPMLQIDDIVIKKEINTYFIKAMSQIENMFDSSFSPVNTIIGKLILDTSFDTPETSVNKMRKLAEYVSEYDIKQFVFEVPHHSMITDTLLQELKTKFGKRCEVILGMKIDYSDMTGQKTILQRIASYGFYNSLNISLEQRPDTVVSTIKYANSLGAASLLIFPEKRDNPAITYLYETGKYTPPSYKYILSILRNVPDDCLPWLFVSRYGQNGINFDGVIAPEIQPEYVNILNEFMQAPHESGPRRKIIDEFFAREEMRA